MKLKLITILALFGAIFLVACGGGDEDADDSAANTSISVVQNDIYYGDSPTNEAEPPTWTVKTGAPIGVSLTNNGVLEHNWAIVNAGETVPEVFNAESDSGILFYETGLVEGGGTYNDSFTAPAPGEYVVICTVAGHYPGMQGRLVVTD